MNIIMGGLGKFVEIELEESKKVHIVNVFIYHTNHFEAFLNSPPIKEKFVVSFVEIKAINELNEKEYQIVYESGERIKLKGKEKRN